MRQAAVLLVEDEAVIRMMIADMLAELGHRVAAEAGTVEDALALAQTTNCDLALLDVNLVGRNTAPVAEILLERGIPFVVITGYNSEGLPSSLNKALVLQKPFPMAKLNDAIEIILSARMP